MKIAIISDIHDNLANLDKFLDWADKQDINVLLCTGDITNNESLQRLATGFKNNIYLVSGNQELYDPSDLEPENIHFLGRTGIVTLAGHKIGLCHEPYLIHELLEKRPDLDIVFYGHTHKPWIETQGDIKIVNPGTLGGMFQKATFAFWEPDKKNIELKILELIK